MSRKLDIFFVATTLKRPVILMIDNVELGNFILDMCKRLEHYESLEMSVRKLMRDIMSGTEHS